MSWHPTALTYLQVRFRIAQQTGHWQEALRCGLELQPYYENVYPQVCIFVLSIMRPCLYCTED